MEVRRRLLLWNLTARCTSFKPRGSSVCKKEYVAPFVPHTKHVERESSTQSHNDLLYRSDDLLNRASDLPNRVDDLPNRVDDLPNRVHDSPLSQDVLSSPGRPFTEINMEAVVKGIKDAWIYTDQNFDHQ